MQRFLDDDVGYLMWLAAHPGEYVANVERRSRAGNVVLHRADCWTINGTPARGDTWTGEYVKWCGGSGEIEAEVRSEYGAHARPCGRCLAVR